MSDIKEKLINKLVPYYEDFFNSFSHTTMSIYNTYSGSYIYEQNLGGLTIIETFAGNIAPLNISIYNLIMGQELLIKNQGLGLVDLRDMTGKTFNSAPNYIINPGTAVKLVYSGSTWITI